MIQAVINPTGHPLVFLYSAPPCPAGSRIQARFRRPGGPMQSTPFKDCQEGVTNNFYIAGLLPQTDYQVEHVIATGFHWKRSPAITAHTDGGPQNSTRQTVIQAYSGAATEDILLQTPITSNAVATDLAGNVLWYYPGNISYITRPEAGGYFFGIVQDPTGDSSRQLLRAFDLAGITVLETNAARVSEQLVAHGKASHWSLSS